MNNPIYACIIDSSNRIRKFRIFKKQNIAYICIYDFKYSIKFHKHAKFSFANENCIMVNLTEKSTTKYISIDFILENMEELKKNCDNISALLAIEKYIKNIPQSKTDNIPEDPYKKKQSNNHDFDS